jgi:hypothetical protein
MNAYDVNENVVWQGNNTKKKQKKNSAILFSFWLWLQNVILLFLLHNFYQLFRLGFQEDHGRCY